MNRKSVLSLLLALAMVISAFPIVVFAAPAANIPAKMLDNAIVRALAYTGYDVQKQKDNGTIYQTGHYGSGLKNNAPDILSDIHYGTAASGRETVADASTVTGKAPDIAKFAQQGLCCASFVTYFISNYLPNIEGADTQSLTDAVEATGTSTKSVLTWQNALEKLVSQGKLEKVGTSPSDADYAKLAPGDIIIFGNSTNSHVHIAIFAGVYNGRHFIIHVGNERGPEINTTESMAHASNGDKASTPNGYYHLPDAVFIETGTMEVKKTDENGKALAGAVFTATNQKTGQAFEIGPTDASGYAKAADPIPFGTYTVKETVFPKDYRAHGRSEWTVTLGKDTPNATVTIDAVNELIPGSAKIVKVSEDGKVDGITFRIQGDGIDKTVKTANGGVIRIDDLKPGAYTVTETEYAQYEPQEVRRITVVSGQVTTVTFSNTLRRGGLTVKKTAEDGLVEGMKFRLSGTSLSGIEINSFAVTDENGIAAFKDVPIGTGYILEEIDTPLRYVVPDKQTAAIEWNKVTNKFFENIGKKFTVTLTKQDSEKASPQGDAVLAGAVYGIYHGDDRIDTYETDASGSFTTKEYVCSSGWTIREITPSTGYLLDETVYPVGAEAGNFTLEHNAVAVDVGEDVIKGSIAIIKHTDDGSTKIETPEAGAQFQIYRKTFGSYDAADPDERDVLVCGEDGFAQSKALPFGEYVVEQTKGWDGRELMPAFTVRISEHGKTYQYLINNAEFKAYLKIVKVDAETGKIIPYAGAAFEIYDPDGKLVEMTTTYPQPETHSRFVTNDGGWLITPEMLPYGTGYSIVEVQAPHGYVLNPEPVYFDVTAENAESADGITLVIAEKPNAPQKGKIRIVKTGEVFSSVTEKDGRYTPVYGESGLAGAEFEICAAEDVFTPDGTLRYAKGDVVDTLTTTADGTAESRELYLGKYEIQETKAPYAMVRDDSVLTAELVYAGQEISITSTSVAVFNERQKVEVKLYKDLEKDELFQIGSGDEILHVYFALYAAEDLTAADGSVIPADGLIEIAGVQADGTLVFASDLPIGSYYVKEYAVDAQYLISEETYPITFTYEDDTTAVVRIEVNNGEAILNRIIRGSITGIKVDEQGEPLPGAVFGLFRADCTDFTKENALLTARSDEDGSFSFENIPYGVWLVREIAAPAGYVLSDEIFPVQIGENGQTVGITVKNRRIPEIPTAPPTGERSALGFWLGLGSVALGGVIACAIMYGKRKKDEDDER